MPPLSTTAPARPGHSTVAIACATCRSRFSIFFTRPTTSSISAHAEGKSRPVECGGHAAALDDSAGTAGALHSRDRPGALPLALLDLLHPADDVLDQCPRHVGRLVALGRRLRDVAAERAEGRVVGERGGGGA